MELCSPWEEYKDKQFFNNTKIKQTVPAWAKGSIRYFGIFHDHIIGSRPHFQNPENFQKGGIHACRLTRGSGFSCYRVIVKSPSVLLRRTRSLVSPVRQLRVSFCSLIGVPRVCPLLVFCCICIICLFSLAY